MIVKKVTVNREIKSAQFEPITISVEGEVESHEEPNEVAQELLNIINGFSTSRSGPAQKRVNENKDKDNEDDE